VIQLEVREARTFFTGKRKELRQMYHCLRVPDKNAEWRTRFLIRKFTGMFWLSRAERSSKIEQIQEQSKWIRFYELRSCSFASGLLPRVESYLRRKKIPYETQDHRRRNPLSDKNFKEIQFQGIEKRAEQSLAVKEALRCGRGILHYATNAGKSEIAAAIIAEYLSQTKTVPKVLFLVHRAALAMQTMERFQKHLTGIPVTMLGAGKKDVPTTGVIVATRQTAEILREEHSQKFEKFMSSCDMVFVDEFHINKAWQVTKLLDFCSAPLRFGLSGTIQEKNKVKMMHYMGMTGPIIAEIRNKELVELGRSARPSIRFVEVHSPKIAGEKFGASYRFGVVENEIRNQLVVQETLRYVKREKKTLLTVARIAHGILLKRMLEKQMDLPCEFLSGSTPLDVRKKVIQQFEKGRIAVLIASPIFDTGMDVPAIESWVNAAGGRGWELVLQRLGRVLRRKEGENRVYITDFIDLQNKYLLEHSLKRFQYYQREEIADISIHDGRKT